MSPAFMGYAATNAFCLLGAYMGMIIAPRYISASEMGLIFELELAFGPLWVYLRFGEVPSVFFFIFLRHQRSITTRRWCWA